MSRKVTYALMVRRLFAILSVLSLLLCAGVCVLWVRGYRTTDLVTWNTGGGYGELASYRGAFCRAWHAYGRAVRHSPHAEIRVNANDA